MAKAAVSLVDQWADPCWRLNNLYTIKDKSGRAVRFGLNDAQKALFDELHYLNVILKARQMGFTTFIQLFMLDACVFNSNTQAGVVAHTREDAEAFFDDKIKFAYDNLDPEIKKAIPATQDSAKSLTFANGSRIRVGTSLRSGTFQYLHVSEFGKVCAQFPSKAKEIVTGAFNTFHAGQFIAVESTAEGQGGYFHDMVMAAKRHAEQGKELTPLDFKLHFFPWYEDQRYALSDEDTAKVSLTEAQEKYFDELDAKHDISLTPNQEAWYVKKQETQRDEMKREYPATVEEAFEASIEGAYYSEEMKRVRKEGRICRVPMENLPVDTFWDLGVNDDMVIWFRQKVGPEHRFIGYYANSGEGLEHYARYLKNWGDEHKITYGTHYMPHDANARRLGHQAKTVQQMAVEAGIRPCAVVPRIPSEAVGIEAVRTYLRRCWFDEASTGDGIWCLDNYRKEWDDDRGVFKDRPRHDKACFLPETQVLTRNGPCAIESLPVTGEVLTPCGWKPYHSPRLTRRDAPLVEVRFADGLTVKCTPEHLFWTENGWKSAASLTPATLIRSSLTRSRSISMASSTAFGRVNAIMGKAASGSIVRLGNLLSAPFRAAVTFIIGTRTRLTIASPTSNASPHPNTSPSRPKTDAAHLRVLTRSPTITDALLYSLTSLRQDGFGTSAIPSECRTGRSGSVNLASADIANRPTRPSSARTGIRKSIAPRYAASLHIESVTPLSETADVWCLTVPDGSWFALSNGAVVHNCHGAKAFETAAVARDEFDYEEDDHLGTFAPVQGY